MGAVLTLVSGLASRVAIFTRYRRHTRGSVIFIFIQTDTCISCAIFMLFLGCNRRLIFLSAVEGRNGATIDYSSQVPSTGSNPFHIDDAPWQPDPAATTDPYVCVSAQAVYTHRTGVPQRANP